MRKHERFNAILELLASEGSIAVEGAAARLGVSSATVRRDLEELAEQSLLTRTHGGAVANDTAYDLPLRYKTARHPSEKQRIGRAAAALIAPGAVIGINGGTTTTEVARALATRPDGAGESGAQRLTLVTNALNIAYELAVRPHLTVTLTAGRVRPQSYELIGPMATRTLDDLALDTAIVGVDAIDVEFGASAHSADEAAINGLMAARARRVIVVADSSKVGHRAMARICSLDRIDTLVTDEGAADQLVERFERARVRVVRA